MDLFCVEKRTTLYYLSIFFRFKVEQLFVFFQTFNFNWLFYVKLPWTTHYVVCSNPSDFILDLSVKCRIQVLFLIKAIWVIENLREGQKFGKVLSPTWSCLGKTLYLWKKISRTLIFLAKFDPFHDHDSLKNKKCHLKINFYNQILFLSKTSTKHLF